MNTIGKTLILLVFLTVGSQAYADEETIEACQAAAALLQENDIDGALEEASWCLEGIQQLKQKQTLALLPDEVAGFIGGETEAQNVMGMKMIERVYSKGNQNIDVMLMGGAGPASTGLAALAQLGLNIGGETGKKMRIQRRTVLDSSSDNSVELMVQLKSSGMMTIKSTNATKETVVEFTKAFPIKELDESLDDS